MSQATDNFKTYLNSIIGKIPDDVHNQLWEHLIAVIAEQKPPYESKSNLTDDDISKIAQDILEQLSTPR